MTNLGYLFAAFAAVWAGLFWYVRFMAKRQLELRDDIAELRRRLDR